MTKFFDYFQIAGVVFFLSVFTGITLYMWLIKNINPTTIVFGKKGIPRFVETLLIIEIAVWITEVLLYSLPLGFRIFQPPLDAQLLDSTLLKFIGAALIICGFVIYILALSSIRSSWRMGVDEASPGKLVTKGIFNISRNPIFIFFDLYFIGTFLINGTLIFLIFAIVTFISLHHQMLAEERVLVRIYGQAYKDYCARTGRYFNRRHLSRKPR